MNCAAASAVSLQRDAQAASKASRSARAHCMRASRRSAAPARVSPAARGSARSERCSVRGMAGYAHRFGPVAFASYAHRYASEALFGASTLLWRVGRLICPHVSQARRSSNVAVIYVAVKRYIRRTGAQPMQSDKTELASLKALEIQ